jgi:site-specific DNA-methyltransferase (adenine-specific)/modification methylase
MDYLIINGDCRKVVDDLSRVDAIITDPPFGIRYIHSGRGRAMMDRRSARRNGLSPIAGDDEPFDPTPWLASGKPCLFWGAQHFADKLPKGGSWLAWDKSLGKGPADTFLDVEFGWCSIPGIQRNGFRWLWKGMTCQKAGESNGHRFHSAQKPIALMRWSIQLLELSPGSIILDPYLGSGPAIIAAIAEGHRAVGIEIDPRYCRIAHRRVERPHAPIPRPEANELLPLFHP